jgi:spermidine/putrescine transport system substrate-binding protein
MTDISGTGDGRRGLSRRTFVKRGVGLATSIGAVGLLEACGSSGSSSSTQATLASSAKPTVNPKVDGDLSWITLDGFCPPSVVKGFEKEYGVKVTQTFINSDQEYIQKLSAGVSYDLVKTSPYYLPRAVAGNLLQPFDPGDLKNFSELQPYFQAPFWDNGKTRYSIIYDWGPDGIMYRTDSVKHVTNSWNDMFTNPEAKGHIYLLDEQGDTLGMALLSNGKSLNSSNPDDVNAAADKLIKLKPSVASFTDNQGPPIQSGDAWLAACYPTVVASGLPQTRHADTVRVYIPKEGALLGADTLSIARNAKHPGTALLFIDWVLRPENSSAIAKFIYTKTGTRAGDEGFATLVDKYPAADQQAFNYSTDLAAVKDNWKQPQSSTGAMVWNQAWSRVKA